MKPNKFITIPDTVYQSSLNATEMVVYGFIYSMSQKGGSCYARNFVFEKELKMSKQKVQRAIRKLVKEDFIVKESRGSIRHLIPKLTIKTSNMTVKESNLIPESIKNDTVKGVINDTHNRITNNKKNNKLINPSIDSSLSSSKNEKLEKLLIKCIEHLNKRFLNIADYKIKPFEYIHTSILIKLFKSYLNSSFDTIDFDSDEFYKYLYCFYLDLRSYIHKHKDSSLRKRYYPFRFNGIDESLKNFSFDNSKFKDKDYLNFKQELEDNDSYDPNANSILNWLKKED